MFIRKVKTVSLDQGELEELSEVIIPLIYDSCSYIDCSCVNEYITCTFFTSYITQSAGVTNVFVHPKQLLCHLSLPINCHSLSLSFLLSLLHFLLYSIYNYLYMSLNAH